MGITWGKIEPVLAQNCLTQAPRSPVLDYCVLFCFSGVKQLLVQKLSVMMEIMQESKSSQRRPSWWVGCGGSWDGGLVATSCQTQEIGYWMSWQQHTQQSAPRGTSQVDSCLICLPAAKWERNREKMKASCTVEWESTRGSTAMTVKGLNVGNSQHSGAADGPLQGLPQVHRRQRFTRQGQGLGRRGLETCREIG